MKAEVMQSETSKMWHVHIKINENDGIFLSAGTPEEIAHKRVDYFNSALVSHVESELTSKLEKIKSELSDGWINSTNRTSEWKTGAIDMRHEILNRLK